MRLRLSPPKGSLCVTTRICRKSAWLDSMHRRALNRLLPSLSRLQAPRQCGILICRGQATQAREPKASPALLEKMNDKELLKVHGFIGGQWVSASDGTTMDVRMCAGVASHTCTHTICSKFTFLATCCGLACNCYIKTGSHMEHKHCDFVSHKKHGRCFQVKNPATGEVIATVPCMKANETSAAVAEATSAWPEWSKMVAKERSKIMRK